MVTMKDLGLSCPDGGSWYTCQGNTTQFIGCCKSDPCQNGQGSCPKKDLARATFSFDRYADIPQQSCDDPKGADKWFTCEKVGTQGPFMGCCDIKNPCTNTGCPASKLLPARLSDNATNAAVFLPTQGTPSPTGTSLPETTDVPDHPHASSGLSPGAIAGIVIGGIAILALILFLLVWKMGWRLRHRERESHVIANFPASYIPNALPDMAVHKSAGADPYKDPYHHSDDSHRTSFVSSVSPSAYAHNRTASDPRHFSMHSMSSGPTSAQGQYSALGVRETSPDTSPRLGPVREVNAAAVELDGASSPPRQPSPAQGGAGYYQPPPYAPGYIARPQNAAAPPDLGESAPLTASYDGGFDDRQQQYAPPSQQPQQQRWQPYRPS